MVSPAVGEISTTFVFEITCQNEMLCIAVLFHVESGGGGREGTEMNPQNFSFFST